MFYERRRFYRGFYLTACAPCNPGLVADRWIAHHLGLPRIGSGSSQYFGNIARQPLAVYSLDTDILVEKQFCNKQKRGKKICIKPFGYDDCLVRDGDIVHSKE